jgi:hypothetical protein
MHPYANFLHHHRGKLDRSRVKDIVEFVQSNYHSLHELREKPEKRAALFSERDALQKQLKRYVKRLRKPLNDLESILKVLVAEQSPAEGPHGSSFKEYVRSLWKRDAGGVAASQVHGMMERLLEKFAVPSFLAEAQTNGVADSLEARDRVLETAVRVHDRWWVYERWARAALLGKQLPRWKEVEKEIRRSHRKRDTAKADSKIKRRLTDLARKLVVRKKESGELILRPKLEGTSEKDLFDELAQRDDNVSNGDSLRRGVKKRMNRDATLPNAPDGRGVEKWVPVVRKVLSDERYRAVRATVDEI